MTWAIITPSYAPDFARCQVLCESIERFVPGDVPHVIVVPARDRALFSSLSGLSGPRTQVLTVESIWPYRIAQLPLQRRFWVSVHTPPVRGWILQQIVKLGVADHVDADVYVFADSEVALIRPFSLSWVTRGDRVRLLRVPGAGTGFRHLHWHRAAARLLGLPPARYFGHDFIGHLNSWRRDTLVRLHERLRAVSGRDLYTGLSRELDFSEFILYGVFCEHVLGGEAGHYYDEQQICHSMWQCRDPEKGLEEFFRGIRSHHAAILVQSNIGVDVGRYRHLLRRAQDAAAP